MPVTLRPMPGLQLRLNLTQSPLTRHLEQPQPSAAITIAQCPSSAQKPSALAVTPLQLPPPFLIPSPPQPFGETSFTVPVPPLRLA